MGISWCQYCGQAKIYFQYFFLPINYNLFVQTILFNSKYFTLSDYQIGF